jgi:hypothetical protein
MRSQKVFEEFDDFLRVLQNTDGYFAKHEEKNGQD